MKEALKKLALLINLKAKFGSKDVSWTAKDALTYLGHRDRKL